MELTIIVVDNEGECPVYEIGSKSILRGGCILDAAESDSICMHR